MILIIFDNSSLMEGLPKLDVGTRGPQISASRGDLKLGDVLHALLKGRHIL